MFDKWITCNFHPFYSISLISRQWKGDDERMCAFSHMTHLKML